MIKMRWMAFASYGKENKINKSMKILKQWQND